MSKNVKISISIILVGISYRNTCLVIRKHILRYSKKKLMKNHQPSNTEIWRLQTIIIIICSQINENYTHQ